MSRSVCVLSLTACLLACGGVADRSEFETDLPVIERSGSRSLRLHWRGAPEVAMPVYAGVVPDVFDRSAPVAVLEAGVAEIEGLDPERRYYFEIAPPLGKTLRVAERRLPLEGAHNFRDLGGYPSADGRHLRWGRLFRSDALSELTQDDVAYVSRLKLRLVCDFRSPRERAEAPDRLPESDPPEVATLGIYDEIVDPAMIREKILSGDLEDLDLAELLVKANRAFVTDATEQYGQMFKRLLAPGGLPGLVHCTAGKDRAGFASAILLLALGVERNLVMRDFLLTNTYTAAETERRLRVIRLFSLFRTDPEQVRPVLSVEPRYLEAAFEEIDKRHGGFDNYLRDALGVTDQERARLQQLLLE